MQVTVEDIEALKAERDYHIELAKQFPNREDFKIRADTCELILLNLKEN